MNEPILEITTNVGCKVNCNYCPHMKTVQHLKGQDYNMSFETFKASLETVPQEIEICFAGYSEPFLNEYCTDMILYADAKGHPVKVYTTTVGLDIDQLRKIQHIKFVSFELHMPTRTGNERIVVDDNYLALLQTIYRTINEVHFIFVCNEKGDERLELVDFVRDKSVVHIDIAQSRAGNVKHIAPEKYKPGKLACDKDLRWNVLLPNGDVAVCCQDFHAQHIIGNLLTQSYPSIFSSKPFLAFKALLEVDNSNILCRNCEFAIEL